MGGAGPPAGGRAGVCNACVEWGGRRWHTYRGGYYERTDKSVKPKRTLRLHRSVWIAAHGPIPEGHDVHHRNENPLDNSLGNLECLPRGEHFRHHRAQRPHPTEGLRRPCDKPHVCTECGAAFMLRLCREGASCRRCTQRRGEARRPRPERACKECGALFKSRLGNFCSQRCVNLATLGATVRVLPEGRGGA